MIVCNHHTELRLLYLLTFLGLIEAVPVDNGVIGEPEIECGSDAIYIAFNTQNYFDGHVYVKGHYEYDNCRTDASSGYIASISVPFSKCGTRRQRSLNPPGMYLSATVIITFHPAFITKVDRAYEIRCYYMEATKTVQQQLDVSMLTTSVVSENIDMPRCRYEVLRGGIYGEPVRYAIVGEPVFHKWTCDTETIDVFCMRVHSCYVDDGHGASVEILDSNGCSNDRYLLQNLEYTADLVAGQETHVFKYADRPSLYFQCQISLFLKESSYCQLYTCRTTEPLGPAPIGPGPIDPQPYPPPYAASKTAAVVAAKSKAATLKKEKRDLDDDSTDDSKAANQTLPVSAKSTDFRRREEFLIDVVADAFNVLDLNDSMSQLPKSIPTTYHRPVPYGRYSNMVCMYNTVFYTVTVIIFLILLATITMVLWLLVIRRKRQIEKHALAYSMRG